eukprot:CCRYP_019724-RA/>CCRYP_019724-RA protein AED:0.30 eAED:0.43 QI:0/0/0/1/0/0/5/0/439
MCAGVVHPTTGETITSYKNLIACPLLREVWTTTFGKEFGNLAQSDNKTGERGTNTMWQFNQRLSRRTHYTHSRSHNVKNPVEQCPQHQKCKVHGSRPQEFLFDCDAGSTRIYENATRIISGPHTRSVQPGQTHQKWWHTHQGCGAMLPDPYRSLWPWMTLDVGRELAEHLIRVLKEHYTVSIDWDGVLYCGIQINWNYDNRTPDISMLNYIHKVLRSASNTSYLPHHKIAHTNHIPRSVGWQRKTQYQQMILTPWMKLASNGSNKSALLFYACAVDNTVLLSLSAIVSEQANLTQLTNKRCNNLLDYCASHPNAIVCFRASNMILNIHSNASYLFETNASSRIADYFFLGSVPINEQPIQLNGAIYIFCGILKFVRSRLMEMRFFWVMDQVNRCIFNIKWHPPGQENLADYFTKHFDARHHVTVQTWYLQIKDSPDVLP